MRRILQSGHPRSGNTLLWKMLSVIQTRRGDFRSFAIDSGLREIKEFYESEKLIHREDAWIDKFSVVDGRLCFVYPNEQLRALRVSPELFIGASSILFTHATPSEFVELPGMETVDARLYVVRDPRAVYVSLCHHAVRPAILRLLPSSRIRSLDEIRSREDLMIHWAERWRDHVRSYLDHADRFELLRYESLVSDKPATVRRLVDLAAPDLDEVEALVASVLEETDFAEMQRASPGHVRRGGTDGWRSEIPARALEIVESIAGEEMRALGYATDRPARRATAHTWLTSPT